MHVLLDGRPVEAGAGATLGDLLPDLDGSYVVAVIRPQAMEAAQTGHIRLVTTAGEVVIETTPLFSTYFGNETIPAPLSLRWSDRYAAAFGPFPSGVSPDRRPHRYARGDVVLGCAGYDPARSVLLFARADHRADFGSGADGGVVGTIVSGRGVIDRWTAGDAVTAVERVVSWADRSTSFTTADPATPLEEGCEVVTRVEVTAEGYGGDVVGTKTARSVEHLVLSLEDGFFSVGRAASTFIRDETMVPMDVSMDLKKPRREGAVTVRAAGGSRGGIYMYREEIPSHPAHTLVGHVAHGIEIVKLAESGQRFRVSVDPPRFDLVGLPLAEARAIAEGRGIGVELKGEGDDLIVVGQAPGTTLEALAKGSVVLSVLQAEKVVGITLDDAHAPATCDIFRRATGLKTHAVGSMPVLFTFEDVTLFQPKIKKSVNILPENVPKDHVPAASLAMTNESRRGAGMVGVRATDNSEFGPTSEPFESTNLIGTVLDLEKVARFKEGETVYVREVKRRG
ncbi:methyl-coenzyme M reductase-associated protein Mmp3 [Methanofollis sp. UBA420]|jgi:putative methanogenesis marker protein 3|uniref:methyl-coenzyme M reductase-associated protein Mmp3 n=1 Tax=Methanofollis sp. UBA420 TaxID=1915514 RepID=UPI00316AC738